MVYFEYHLERVPRESSLDTVERLNALGAQGWELVFIAGVDAQGNHTVWFKRASDTPPVADPPPVVTSISPTTTNTGSQKISVRGTGFTPLSVIVFGGIEQTTTFQDPTWMQATVAAPVGIYDVVARDVGGDSNAMQFEFK